MSHAEEQSHEWHQAREDENATAIAEALAHLRPDAEEFAEGVARRIERAGEKAAESTLHSASRQPAERSTWMRFGRRAAVFLPVWLLPKPLMKLLAVAAVPVAKKSAWYYVPGLVALPLVMVAISVVSFFYAVKQAVIQDAGEPDVDVTAGLDLLIRKYILYFFIALIPLLAFTGFRPLDGAVLGLLALLALFVGLVQISMRSSRRTRSDLGVGFALGLGMISTVCPVAILAENHWLGEFGARWIYFGFVLGAIICAVLARPFPKRGSLGGILLGFAVVSVVNSGKTMTRLTTREEVIEFVERGSDEKLELRPLSNGTYIAALDELAKGERSPDTSVLREQLAAGHREEGDTTSESVLIRELKEAGYFRGRDYEDLDGVMLARILETRIDWGYSGLREAVKALRKRELSEAERERFAQYILAGKPDGSSWRMVGGLLSAVAMLEQLGDHQPSERMAEAAREFVRLSWTGSLGDRKAGFDFDLPESGDVANRAARKTSSKHLYLPASTRALALMTHFGVPDEIDLEALEVFLWLKARHSIFDDVDSKQVQAYVALETLHRLPEWQPIAVERASVLGVLTRYRVLIAALLLILFCIVVTLRAPKAIAETEPAV